MFTPNQFRAKAAEYTVLASSAESPESAREFQKLEQSFSALADNEQWLSDHYDETVQVPAPTEGEKPGLAAEEEHILRYLGAALIMKWNTLPKKLQRELFDTAGSMGEIIETASLRGQIARFLHKHKDDKVEA